MRQGYGGGGLDVCQYSLCGLINASVPDFCGLDAAKWTMRFYICLLVDLWPDMIPGCLFQKMIVVNTTANLHVNQKHNDVRVFVCVGLFLGMVVAIQSRQQQHVLKQMVHPCFSCHGRGSERRHDSICYVNVRFVSGSVSPLLYCALWMLTDTSPFMWDN